MPLSEEHKAKMAEGRRRAAEAKVAARAAQPTAPPTEWLDPPAHQPKAKPNGKTTPEPATSAPAAAPPVAAGGFLPSDAEFAQMDRFYDILAGAGILPRGKGDDAMTKPQVLACLLKGREIGLQPMESVQGLYPSEKGLAMRADLMRSLVQRSGLGVIVPVELTDQVARVRGIRYGIKGRADEDVLFEYTLTQAQRAGFLRNEAWQNHPKACLFAKASGEAADRLFSDILGGARYIPEELVTVAPAPRASKLVEAPAEPTSAQPPTPAVPEPPAPPQREPVASSSPPPAGPRELTMSFETIGKGGAIEVVRTAGITQPVMQAILAFAQQSESQRAMAKEHIAHLGQPQLKYLTDDEGIRVLQALQGQYGIEPLKPAAPEPEPTRQVEQPPEPPAADLFIAFAEHHNRQFPDYPLDAGQLMTFVADSFDVDRIEQLDENQRRKGLAEIAHASRDPQGFALLVGRANR